MKITKITLHSIELPFKIPFELAYETYYTMPSIIVKIETDEGIVGFGEGVPDQHVTGETLESTWAILEHYIAPALIGENPFNLERIHEKMNQVISSAPTAKAAIDIACYDLIGKKTNQPLHAILGGKYHDKITVPFVLSIQSPEVMAEQAKAAIAEGYTGIKIKVGKDAQEDVARIRAVREAIGTKAELRVDANQGWETVATTMSVLDQIRDCNLGWMEQPIHMNNVQGLADIRSKTTIPIMIDEGLQSPQIMNQVIQQNGVDFVNIKLMKCGGIYPALKLLAQVESAGLRAIIGSMIECSVATAAGAHLAASRKIIIGNEMAGPICFSEDIAEIQFDGEELLLNDLPGLGLTIDEEQLKRMTLKEVTVAVLEETIS